MSKPLTSYAKTRRPSQKRIQSPKQSMDSNTILSCRLNASRLQKCIIWYSSNVKDACAIPAPVQTYLQLPKSIIWFHSQNQWLLTPIQAPYATTHHLTRIADYIIFKIYDCNSRSTKQSQVYESISKITPTSAYLRLLKSLSLQLKYHCLKRAANKNIPQPTTFTRCLHPTLWNHHHILKNQVLDLQHAMHIQHKAISDSSFQQTSHLPVPGVLYLTRTPISTCSKYTNCQVLCPNYPTVCLQELSEPTSNSPTTILDHPMLESN